MKTAIDNQETNKFEFFKRILYSFQVLLVGIALPLLFLIGISDGNQKKSIETGIKEDAVQKEITAKPIAQLNIARI